MFRQKVLFNASLQRWIDEKGRVDYVALKKDEVLKRLWSDIKDVDLSTFNHKEAFAFWLNAYNLLTIKGVLEELEKNFHWNGNISLWSKIKFFYLRKFFVAGKRMSLYAIENKILRKTFKDPRIHFAINCASVSCPVLPPELFTPENLEPLLERLTKDFVNNDNHVRLEKTSDTLWLNPIFKWYKKDFKVVGGVLEFIKKYHVSEEIKSLKDKKEVKIKYLQYDWSLNAKNDH